MNVSHIVFVDDTIVFCDNHCEQIVNLHCVLAWFEVVMGLRVS